jgi:transcriptional/translational regulatory protein YebC/TACO1
MAALEAGAEDATEHDGEITVYTELKDLAKVRDGLSDAGYIIAEASLSYEPTNVIEINDAETARKVMRLIDALDELDDTVQTYANVEIADGVELD